MQASNKASDDLLQLAGNPFADMMGAPAATAAVPPQAQPYTNGQFTALPLYTHRGEAVIQATASFKLTSGGKKLLDSKKNINFFFE